MIQLKGKAIPALRFDFDDAAGCVNIFSEGPSGDGRFMTIRDGGGHWEITTNRHLPEGAGLELDAAGFAIVHQNPD